VRILYPKKIYITIKGMIIILSFSKPNTLIMLRVIKEELYLILYSKFKQTTVTIDVSISILMLMLLLLLIKMFGRMSKLLVI